MQAAQAKGIACDGPYPSDTVFVRARVGQFDAVLTMFHDQGQIAMKLIGFDKGVTLLGGFPMPITTPAHGTAYDIAGKGIANIGASRNAVLLAARMGREAAAKSGSLPTAEPRGRAARPRTRRRPASRLTMPDAGRSRVADRRRAPSFLGPRSQGASLARR